MIIGIIQIFFGTVILLIGLFADTSSSVQQTVAALWDLIGVILICFGILSVLISKLINIFTKKMHENVKSESSTWICKFCGTENDECWSVCPKCGKSMLDSISKS